LGELHVRYAVIFEVPVLESTTGSTAANNQVALFTNGGQAGTSGVAQTLLLATPVTNGIGAVNTAGSILLPSGNYLVDFTGIATAATNMTINTLSLFKNVADVSNANRIVAAAAVLTEDTLGGSWFVAMNGTDTLSLQSTVTGTGVVTCAANLRIVAI
jgi:hypothetical protein